MGHIEGVTLKETKECVGIVENMRLELSREMVYNDRNDNGNKDALNIFRLQWNTFSMTSPLCEWALNLYAISIDDQKLFGIKGPEKALVVAINKIEELFRITVSNQREARDFVSMLFMRMCYLYEKLKSVQEKGRT